MRHQFEGAESAGAWQISTPPLLATAPLRGALRLFHQAGLDVLRAKSLAQTAYLADLLSESGLTEPPYSFTIGTPAAPEQRGGHLAVEHAEAARISRTLRARGFVPDFRAPNVIRLAPIPLYTSYHELWQTVQALREIIDTGAHLQLAEGRALVAWPEYLPALPLGRGLAARRRPQLCLRRENLQHNAVDLARLLGRREATSSGHDDQHRARNERGHTHGLPGKINASSAPSSTNVGVETPRRSASGKFGTMAKSETSDPSTSEERSGCGERRRYSLVRRAKAASNQGVIAVRPGIKVRVASAHRVLVANRYVK